MPDVEILGTGEKRTRGRNFAEHGHCKKILLKIEENLVFIRMEV
jgi:hypothetical protein